MLVEPFYVSGAQEQRSFVVDYMGKTHKNLLANLAWATILLVVFQVALEVYTGVLIVILKVLTKDVVEVLTEILLVL